MASEGSGGEAPHVSPLWRGHPAILRPLACNSVSAGSVSGPPHRPRVPHAPSPSPDASRGMRRPP